MYGKDHGDKWHQVKADNAEMMQLSSVLLVCSKEGDFAVLRVLLRVLLRLLLLVLLRLLLRLLVG